VALALQENDGDMCKAVAAFRTARVAQQVGIASFNAALVVSA
jgi:hypothetical protein